MDTSTLIVGALILLVLLFLIAMLLFRGRVKGGFSIAKLLRFNFEGSNEPRPSEETKQKTGREINSGRETTTGDIVGRDKVTVTNNYTQPSRTNSALAQALLDRVKFLDDINDSHTTDYLESKAKDLVSFAREVQYGNTCAEEINKLTERPIGSLYFDEDEDESEIRRNNEKRAQKYREQLIGVRDKIRKMIDELIKLQQ